MAIEITQELIKEFFSYDEVSGVVTIKPRARKWFVSKCSHPAFNSRYGNKPIKTKDKDGYLFMTVLGVRCLAHKIACMYMTGEWPNEMDHINGIRDDNSWVNLRSVTRRENLKNLSVKKNTPYGILGISKIKTTGRWRAKIATQINKHTHLGVFSDFFEAVCCRKSAENKHGYHANHGKTLSEGRL